MLKRTSVFLLVGLMLAAAAWPLRGLAGPLVVNHTAVNLCTNLTAADIARVQRLWLSYAGESHSSGVRIGCQLLANAEARFGVAVQENGTPAGAATNHLRLSRATWGDLNHATGWQYN